MILHGFAWRSPANMIFQLKTKIFNKKSILKHSMGLFVFYFSTKKIYSDVQHHTIIVNKRQKELLDDMVPCDMTWHDMIRYAIARHDTIWHDTTRYNGISCNTTSHHRTQYYTVLYYIAPYDIILYSTILYRIIYVTLRCMV